MDLLGRRRASLISGIMILLLSIVAGLCLGLRLQGFVSAQSGNTLTLTSPNPQAFGGSGGSMEDGMAYDSGKGEIFMPAANNTVLVISDSNNSVVATVPVGIEPMDAAYDSGKSEVFVANNGTNTVSVISDSNNSVVATVPVGIEPSDVVYDSGKGEVFVTGNFENTVSVISDSNNSVVATIWVGDLPYGMAYDSGKGEVFVTRYYADTVSVISDSSNSVVAAINVGTRPWGVVYDSGKGEVFVANTGDNTVSVISDSSNSVVATINVAQYSSGIPGPVGMPEGMAYDSGKGEIFVANGGAYAVSVISDSNSSVVATIGVVNLPLGSSVTYDSGKGELFVTGNPFSVISDSNNSVALFTMTPTGLVKQVPTTSTATTSQALLIATPLSLVVSSDYFFPVIVIVAIVPIVVVAVTRRKRPVQVTAPAMVQTAQPLSKEMIDNLERLAALYAQGSLTKEEYDALKTKARAPAAEVPAWTGPVPTGKLTKKRKHAIVAAVLSFFIPGVGQIYVGRLARGIALFFLVSLLLAIYIGIGILNDLAQSVTSAIGGAFTLGQSLIPPWIQQGLELAFVLAWLLQIVDAYLKAKRYNKVVTQTGRAPW